MLSTRVVSVKNFPAIHWEYQGVDSDNKTVYMARKMLFAGNSMIDVISMSLSLEVARRNGNDFIAVHYHQVSFLSFPNGVVAAIVTYHRASFWM